MIDPLLIQEYTEIMLNINEAEYNEEITADEAMTARRAIGEDVAKILELPADAEKEGTE